MTADADLEFAARLAAARAGDSWAFTQLYEALSGQVAGFVRARGVRDVDDIVNDVFLAVFTGLDRFCGDESSFRAWVFRITRNKVSDWFRHSSRDRQRADTVGHAASVACQGGDVESDQVVADLGLQDLLATLTPGQREVVLLRVVADLSAQQTAEVLDKPVTAIKALQRRAIRGLRTTISSQVVSN